MEDKCSQVSKHQHKLNQHSKFGKSCCFGSTKTPLMLFLQQQFLMVKDILMFNSALCQIFYSELQPFTTFLKLLICITQLLNLSQTPMEPTTSLLVLVLLETLSINTNISQSIPTAPSITLLLVLCSCMLITSLLIQ